MDSNKDEALRCIHFAEDAIASGNKQHALRFIKIARRLNANISVDELLAACEKLELSDSRSNVFSTDEKQVDEERSKPGLEKFGKGLSERNYTEEHVELIRQIKRNKDYYAILGVERSSSVEEIRKAYRKLSLKVHPDKNKAPGSEEAFKKVCKAFKCLSDDESRRQYDHVGLVDECEYNQQHNVRPRRRRAHRDFYDDDFDPYEIFRSFFGQPDAFRSSHVYRTRGMREEFHGTGPNFVVLLQILPFLLIILLAYLPYSEPDYSLHRNYNYQIPRITEKLGIEFFVKSSSFDQRFPHGSSARADIEDTVIKDYKNLLWRYCRVEHQKHYWNKNLPTPHCNKLKNLGLA